MSVNYEVDVYDVEYLTPCCGDEEWFDREICPEPCNMMHYRCNGCGRATDRCQFESDGAMDGQMTIFECITEEWLRRHEYGETLYP